MNTTRNHYLAGAAMLAAFAVWTLLIKTVDVKPWGQEGTDIGFAHFNCAFHELTGAHMGLYIITDWLGLVPVAVCLAFAILGLVQLIKRRSLFKVDRDIIILGIYYIMVIVAYSAFEMITINYRPVLIGGYLEGSYPSSTTLLVLCVMPTLVEQMNRRAKADRAKADRAKAVSLLTMAFTAFMVIGRLVSGVHWFTDIAGGVMLAAGLFTLYKAAVLTALQPGEEKEAWNFTKNCRNLEKQEA